VPASGTYELTDLINNPPAVGYWTRGLLGVGEDGNLYRVGIITLNGQPTLKQPELLA